MHEWRSHTAEIELAIDAETPEQVFVEAAAALSELISLARDGEEARHEVALEASDHAALLVEWLQELIFLADTESFVPEQVDELRLESHAIRATVVGRRSEVEPLVKAATYHQLQFTCVNAIWQARVVLDV